MTRRAVAYAITDPEAGDDGFPLDSLATFSPYATQLAMGLSRVGFEVNDPLETKNWTAEQIANDVLGALASADSESVRVVHVLAHGRAMNDSLRVVGGDGRTHIQCDLDHWLRFVNDGEPSRPLTLFILDTCNSGLAARMPWTYGIDPSSLRGWVISASAPDRSAYDGRLSLAVAAVLQQLAEGTLIDARTKVVPWATFRDRVIDDVERQQVGSFHQVVHSTLLDRTINPPFFTNPNYVEPDPLASVGDGRDPRLISFLEGALDLAHFTERASGRRDVTDRAGSGVFTGRRAELMALSDWIDYGADDDVIRVVTGSPGSGKSALLGLLLCSTHRDLRPATERIWRAAEPHIPQAQNLVVGVHARDQSVRAVMDSIAAQLELKLGDDDWTPLNFAKKLNDHGSRPLILIDAVDESANIRGLLTLMLALSEPAASSLVSPARLVVGTRAGAEWTSITEWIGELDPRQVIDLNATPIDVQIEDIASYVASVMPRGPFTQRAATASATVIVNAVAKTNEWGSFLVASLFAHSNLPDRQLRNEEDLQNLIASVPRSLPEVLELDLAQQASPELGWNLLTSLAWAKGSGMPLRLLQVITRTLLIDVNPPATDDIARLLNVLRFYLRTSAAESGETLYRLFHQGLVDHIRTRTPSAPTAILEAILQDRPSPRGWRQWATAETYLKQHALLHALDANKPAVLLADADFLVHVDGRSAMRELARIRHPSRSRQDLVPRGSMAEAGANALLALEPEEWAEGPTGRRHLLQQVAVARSQHDLEQNLANTDWEFGWSVLWCTETSESHPFRRSLDIPKRAVHSISAINGAGLPPLAVTAGEDGGVRIWDTRSSEQLGEKLSHTIALSIACAFDLHEVLHGFGGGYDGALTIWDLDTREPTHFIASAHAGGVTAVACALDEHGVLRGFSGGTDGALAIWDLRSGEQTHRVPSAHAGGVTAVSCAPDKHGVLRGFSGGADGTLATWDLGSGERVHHIPSAHVGRVRSVACALDEHGGLRGFSGGADSALATWDLDSGEQIHHVASAHPDGVTSVSCALDKDGTLHGFSGGVDGAIRMWNLFERDDDAADHDDDEFRQSIAELRKPPRELERLQSPIRALACAALPDGSIIVLAAHSRGVAVLDPCEEAIGNVPDPRTPTYAIAASPSVGRELVLSAGQDRAIVLRSSNTGVKATERLRGHVRSVLDLELVTNSKGEDWALSVSMDRTVRIWSLDQARQARSPLRHYFPQHCVVATVVEGRTIAAVGGQDGRITLWDVESGELYREEICADESPILALAFGNSRSGPVVVSGSGGGRLRSWRLLDGTPTLPEISAHSGAIRSLRAWTSSDGGIHAVSGGDDGSTRVWNLDEGTSIAEMSPHAGPVYGVDQIFDDTGTSWIASCGADQYLHVEEDGRPTSLARFRVDGIASAVRFRSATDLVVGTSKNVVAVRLASVNT